MSSDAPTMPGDLAESKIMSQRWLQQAWEADRPETGPPSDHVEPNRVDIADDGEPEREDGWVEHAGFIIAFDRRVEDDGERWQTRVWDSKRLVEVVAPGTAPETWIGFVLRHANLPAFD